MSFWYGLIVGYGISALLVLAFAAAYHWTERR